MQVHGLIDHFTVDIVIKCFLFSSFILTLFTSGACCHGHPSYITIPTSYGEDKGSLIQITDVGFDNREETRSKTRG